METETLIAVAGVTLLVIGTPGPANVVLSAMGAAYGLRSIRFALAVPTGFLFNCLLIGLVFWGAGEIATDPAAILILRLVGCAYLFWLTWKIWSAPVKTGTEAAGPGVIFGLLVHPVNPKAYFFLITIFGQFVLPSVSQGEPYWQASTSVLLLVFVFGYILNLGWWLIGCMLGAALKNEHQHRLLNRALAVALGLVTLNFLVDGLLR